MSLPPPRPNGRYSNDDFEVIVEEADHRILPTCSIYDLDRMLEAMRKGHRVDVYYTRRHLKWLMKRTYRYTGTVPRNPWWMPKK